MATVLIVDDAAFTRMMLKDVLVKNGYEIVGEAVSQLPRPIEVGACKSSG